MMMREKRARTPRTPPLFIPNPSPQFDKFQPNFALQLSNYSNWIQIQVKTQRFNANSIRNRTSNHQINPNQNFSTDAPSLFNNGAFNLPNDGAESSRVEGTEFSLWWRWELARLLPPSIECESLQIGAFNVIDALEREGSSLRGKHCRKRKKARVRRGCCFLGTLQSGVSSGYKYRSDEANDFHSSILYYAHLQILFESNNYVSLLLLRMTTRTPDKGKGKMEEVEIAKRNKTIKGVVITEPSANSDGTPDPKEKGSNPHSEQSSGKKKPTLDVARLRSRLSGVKENIIKLQKTTLYATIIGEPVELKEIRKKMKFDWKFVEGGVQVTPLSHNWFEMKFSLPEDRDRVWNGRPFHILGQLLLLKPWKQGFDPASESISTLDMWIRIPGLPSEYISRDVLATIIEENGLGTILKLGAFTTKGVRVRYPRICINVDITMIPDKKVMVLDENDNLKEYPVWFEEFPEGCGSCGSPEHFFSECPHRVMAHNPITVTLPKPRMKENRKEFQTIDEDDGDWIKVASKNKVAGSSSKVGNPKAELLKNIGINVTYNSESSSSKLSGKTSSISSHVGGDVNMDPNPAIDDSVQIVEDANKTHHLDSAPGRQAEVPPLPFLLESGNEDFYEYEDILCEADLAEPMDYLCHETIEDVLNGIPTGVEVQLANFYTPAMKPELMKASNDTSTPPGSVVQRLEQLGMATTSNSEPGKRRNGKGDSDTASSYMKEGGAKKPRNDE